LATFLEWKKSSMWADAFGGLGFASSEEVQALQAADLFAFCTNREQTTKLLRNREKFPAVRAFRRLHEGLLKDGALQQLEERSQERRISRYGTFRAS
jgi:hypothetical protein